MEQKERLIDLILSTPPKEFPFGSRAQGKTYQTAGNMADHLLANGVIAPPCKLGDKMYVLMHRRSDEYNYKEGVNEIIVRHIRIRTEGIFVSDFWGFMNWKIGERAFHTKEEATRALAERSNNEQN